MEPSDTPRLRHHVSICRDEHSRGHFFVWDRLGLSEQPERLNVDELFCVQMLDGCHSLRDIQVLYQEKPDGRFVPLDVFQALVGRLDAALLLEGAGFREAIESWLREPVREPRCIGCYEGAPPACAGRFAGCSAGRSLRGLAGTAAPDGRLRGALVPHMDYARGGSTYTWSFKEVCERSDASLFVIIATSHYSPDASRLMRKGFRTPLGITPTDQSYIDRLIRHYGDEPALFRDELAHLPEHSIELEVVFLQYLYENRRPIRIVPLLVGSFHDCVLSGASPTDCEDIGRMVERLRRVEAETTEPICYLISGDLGLTLAQSSATGCRCASRCWTLRPGSGDPEQSDGGGCLGVL